MEVAVDGWRASIGEWQAVRNLPSNELPRLTQEQREVASKLGIPEDDYARSALAGERTREELLKKAQRLAHILEARLRKNGSRATVVRVLLRTVEHRFEVELEVNGDHRLLRIDENLVDDYFDNGSERAEADLHRILDRALASVTA